MNDRLSIEDPRPPAQGFPADPAQDDPVGGSRAWVVLAVVSVLACLAVHVAIMAGTQWPAFPFDEVTLLQMSRWFVGEPIPETIRGAGYFPGWALVIAPLWWFTSDPETVYRASLLVGVAVSMVTIWPLAALGRRLGLAGPAAVVAAAFTMALPARAVHADYSMSERLLTLFLVLAILCAFRIAERSTPLRVALFALVLAATMFSHVRMSVVLIAAGVWLLMRLPRDPRNSGLGLVLVGASYWLVNEAGRLVNQSVLGRSFSQGESLLDRLTSSRPSLFLRVGLGQSWHQSLASYGLVAVGLVVVVVLVWHRLRRWDVDGWVFVLGATSAMVALSLVQWANDYSLFDNPFARFDVWIYGRYIDPIGTVVTLLGASALLAGISRAVGWWSVALNAVALAGSALVLTWQVPTWGFVTPAHAPGILPWTSLLPDDPWPRNTGFLPTFTNDNRVWLIAPLCVLLVLGVALLLRGRRMLVASGLVGLAVVGSLLSAPASAAFHEQEGFAVEMRDQVEAFAALDDVEEVGFARQCDRVGLEAVAQNYFGYALLPARLVDVREAADFGDLEIVVACEQWPLGSREGARRVAGESVYASFAWVMPGPLQDELEAAGQLVPVAETGTD